MLDQSRVGSFTSSQIYKLMGKGRGKDTWSKTALSYIEEVAIEREVGRSLSGIESSRSTSWGNALEGYVASKLDAFEWSYQHETTLTHQSIKQWKGTPDLVGAGKVGDIKCPYTLKSFARLAKICQSGESTKLLLEFPEYFWQLVSNAVLTNSKTAELIVFCPSFDELEDIRDYLADIDNTDLQTESQWIAFSSDERLPWIPATSKFKSFNRLSFEVNANDKRRLTDRVEAAVLMLNQKDC